MKTDDIRHLKLVALILLLGGCGGLIGRAILTPASYGDEGHYRWDAVSEIAGLAVVNQSPAVCAKCHAPIAQLHDKDVHSRVPCNNCHGDGQAHVAYHEGAPETGVATPEAARMPKKFTLEGCLFCHRKLNAKPADFPQVDPAQHYAFLHVTDSATLCIACHSPHEPLFLATGVTEARLHPAVQTCEQCHDTRPAGNPHEVPAHPVIFECVDCHPAVVNDFRHRSHYPKIQCATCHQYHRESDNAGRMYKNGNVRFCLLCHARAPFKDPQMPPKIEWPLHLRNVGAPFSADRKVCIDCHEFQVHLRGLGVGRVRARP